MSNYIGIDLSLNHFGITCRNSEVESSLLLSFSSNKKKFVKRFYYNTYVFSTPTKNKEECDANFQARRREKVLRNICYFLDQRKPSSENYVCMEDYAYTTRTGSSHQLAELVGSVKHILWTHGYKLILIDPTTLKLWATGKGNSYKKDMVEVAKSLTASVFPKCSLLEDPNLSENRKVNRSYAETVVDLDGPVTDIADSIILSYLVEQFVLLKKSSISFAVLPEHQARVYTKTTKTNPVRLYDRPFICEG